ncbi:MAG TPA: choice-of-anchor Q domain-containing protein, partial [Pyrinomonadaceae bacterium]|nr:choice-of-anchor Q domain-containing protein [Pyrinomonadaceae bacterium]
MKRITSRASICCNILTCALITLIFSQFGTNPSSAAEENAAMKFFDLPQAVWLAATGNKSRVYFPSGNESTPVSASGSTSAPQQTITVTNLNDSGAGSLRQAITDYGNSSNLSYVINFSVTGTINLLSPLPPMRNVSINGPGAKLLTVRRSENAGSGFGIFTIQNGDVIVNISGITISNGSAGSFSGGGGGIRILHSQTNITDCVITGNRSADGGGGIRFSYSGSNNYPTLDISNTTLGDNFAGGAGDAIEFSVTALYPTINISNSTISGNRNINPVSPAGGSIRNNNAGTGNGGINIKDSTIADNDFGILNVYYGHSQIVYKNSIISEGVYVKRFASESGSYPSSVSQGNNLIQFPFAAAPADNFFLGNTASSDLVNIDPLLLPLGDYGGAVPTRALDFDSPAIDTGSTTATIDARRQTRPADGDANGTAVADIGAFERQKFVVFNTNDAGAGSLRQAILDNNQTGGGNLIAFNIAGSGVKTIAVNAADGYGLPAVTRSVLVDGFTQTGAAKNTSTIGSNAALKIELNGEGVGASGEGLRLAAFGSGARGLI